MHASDGVFTPDLIIDRFGRPVTATTYTAPDAPPLAAPRTRRRRRPAGRSTGAVLFVLAVALWGVSAAVGAAYWFAGPYAAAALVVFTGWLAFRPAPPARPVKEKPTMHHTQHTAPPAGVVTVPAGTATYRLRVFDANYEVLKDRTYVVRLDLLGPAAAGILAAQLEALTGQALAAREEMSSPRLEVWDLTTGRKVLDVA